MTNGGNGVRAQRRLHRETTQWTDESGNEWLIHSHWANIRGKPTFVGLDIRSFMEWHVVEDGIIRTRHEPLGARDVPVELTPKIVRAIETSKIRDAAREKYVTELEERSTPDGARKAGWPDSLAEMVSQSYARRAAALTARGEPRRRLPSAKAVDLENVAKLYQAAVAKGDKTPAKTVERQLREAGTPLSPGKHGRDQVVRWIYRARKAGLIPPL